MKVLYDFDGFKNKYGGVARCTVELIANLPPDIKYELAFSVSKSVYLENSDIATNIRRDYLDVDTFLPYLHIKGKGRLFRIIESNFTSFPTFININKPISIEALQRQNFDVFHCTSTDCDTYFLDYLKGKPFVLTVHDMISEIFGTNNHQVKVKQQLVPLAKHIIAVSQQTKKDLIKFLKVPEEKITVIYHGAPNPQDFNRFKVIEDPYFLFVGNRHSYKNFKQTLKDFALFHLKYSHVKLVVVGGGAFSKDEQSLLKSFNLTCSVIQKSASDEQLFNLYRGAIAFIFPSLYEGFGMPIIESFAYGCPALLNDTSCFTEIAGSAAVFFHSRPNEEKSDLAEKMEYLYELEDEERAKLINKGLSRASFFCWKRSSEQLADVYRKCLD